MPLRQVPLTVYRGVTFEVRVTLRSFGQTVDLTDFEARMLFVLPSGLTATELVELTELDYAVPGVVIGEGPGLLHPVVPASETSTWPVGAGGSYGLLVRSPSQRVTLVLKGSWSVEDPVAEFNWP